MRLIDTLQQGTYVAKIYKDIDWGEYRVKYFKDGKHLGEDADTHTDDLEDAKGTATAVLQFYTKGATK